MFIPARQSNNKNSISGVPQTFGHALNPCRELLSSAAELASGFPQGAS